MIGSQLRPIPWRNEFQLHLAMESYALTYLASYNTGAYTARSEESLKRAFGMDLVHTFPRVGQVPAYTLAIWKVDNVPVRCTVAIEGSSTASQIFAYGASGWAIPRHQTTRVIENAKVWAEAIYDALKLDAAFMSCWNAAGCNFICAGYSLGGAIAEVLSAIIRDQRPTRLHRLYTFGCPRVGTAAWKSAEKIADVRMNYYCGTDGINAIPVTQQGNVANVFQDVWTPIIGFVAPQNPIQRFSLSGSPLPLDGGSTITQPYVYRQSLLGLTPTNPWYYHQKDAYRLMFSNLANMEADALPYRFIYLEFPDDNTWGNFYTPGVTDWSLLHNLAGENPPDKVVSLPDYYVEGGTGGGGDGDGDGSTGGGGDEEPPERQVIRANPNVRSRRQR